MTIAAATEWRRRVLGTTSRPAALLGVAMLVQGGLALWWGSRGWFSGDLLHYYAERGGVPNGTEGLNDPHVSHWQLVLIVAYRVLFALFGLRTYLPYILLTVLVHLALVALLYRLLTRLGTRPWTAAAAALIVLTYGAGSEVFLVEAPVALSSTLPLAAVGMDRLLADDFSPRSAWVAGGLLLVGVTISVGGVLGAIWVGLFAASRGIPLMLRCVGPAALAFVGWYLLLGREGSRVVLGDDAWLDVPEAAWTLLTTPFGDVLGGSGLGPVIFLLAVMAVPLGARSRPLLAASALAGLTAAMAHAVLVTVAALPYGMEAVLTSRYRYFVLVLLLPALCLGIDTAVDRLRFDGSRELRRLAIVPAVVAVGGMLVHAGAGQHGTAALVADGAGRTKAYLNGTRLALSVGQPMLTTAVPGFLAEGRDFARLSDPAVEDKLPRMRSSPEDRIAAESLFFVKVTDGAPLNLPKPARLRSTSFTEDLRLVSGCRTYETSAAAPVITLRSYLGAQITVTSGATTITTRLIRPEEGVSGESIRWQVHADHPVEIGTSTQVADLEVTFDSAGQFTLCVP